MSMNVHKLIAGKNDHGRRVDRIVRKLFPDLPLSFVYKLIRQGKIKINGKKCKANTVISEHDELEVLENISTINTCINYNTSKNKYADCLGVLGNSSFKCIYDSDDILIINKPRGIEVHGANSIAEIVKHSLQTNNSLSFIPAPVHRLDKNTSGLLIIAKSLVGATRTSKALHDKTIQKHYLAVLEGTIETDITLEHFLERDKTRKITRVYKQHKENSHKAVLIIHPLLSNSKYTFAEIDLKTGFTHQIRAQCGAYNHPLAGDKKYGSILPIPYYFLHAWRLGNLDKIFTECPHEIRAQLTNEQIEYLEYYCNFTAKQLAILGIV